MRPSNNFYSRGAYYRPGYAYRYGYGYRYPYYRNGVWIGAYGFGFPYYGLGWPYGHGYGYPYASDYTYPGYGETYPAPEVFSPDYRTSAYPPAAPAPVPGAPNAAQLTVRLPADAQLWIDGQPTNQTGVVRNFETPANLNPGQTYSYKLTAQWVQNGQTVTRERTVTFQAGNQAIVDMTSP